MDDIFFIENPDWKNNIKKEWKKYPSLIYFLFKNPECEKQLIKFLGKTDSIKKKEKNKFPKFWFLLSIFSAQNCLNENIEENLNNKINLDIQKKNISFISKKNKEEIIYGIKSRESSKFINSPNIDWLGLLIYNDSIKKYFSNKMIYINTYLEQLSSPNINIDKANEEKFNKIIKKIIEYLFDIILNGKLDELFSKKIHKLDNFKIKKIQILMKFYILQIF